MRELISQEQIILKIGKKAGQALFVIQNPEEIRQCSIIEGRHACFDFLTEGPVLIDGRPFRITDVDSFATWGHSKGVPICVLTEPVRYTSEEIAAKFAALRCAHGLRRNRNKPGTSIVTTGRIGHCECCGTSFGTLGDKKMCPPCKRLEAVKDFV